MQIVVKRIEEKEATKLGKNILQIINYLTTDQELPKLDLRRLDEVIVTTDFSGEMNNLSPRTKNGSQIEFTNEDYAKAEGKVLLFPKDNDFTIVIVLGYNIVKEIEFDKQDDEQNKKNNMAIHFIHHELCHVHDMNIKLNKLNNVMLKEEYKGKKIITGPLAEVCWSEYYANYLSGITANTHNVILFVSSLVSAIKETKNDINVEIKKYRTHADLDHLLNLFQRHGHYLLKCACYVLGYVDNFKIITDKLPDLYKAIKDSYFENTWNGLHEALILMRSQYPENWNDLTVYDPLYNVIEGYYVEMGLILEKTEEGGLYINIPYNPETMPF